MGVALWAVGLLPSVVVYWVGWQALDAGLAWSKKRWTEYQIARYGGVYTPEREEAHPNARRVR